MTTKIWLPPSNWIYSYKFFLRHSRGWLMGYVYFVSDLKSMFSFYYGGWNSNVASEGNWQVF